MHLHFFIVFLFGSVNILSQNFLLFVLNIQFFKMILLAIYVTQFNNKALNLSMNNILLYDCILGGLLALQGDQQRDSGQLKRYFLLTQT